MRKAIIIGAVITALILVGYSYLKVNPPLSAGASSSTNDRKVVLVSIGNRGSFGGIEITEVLINKNTPPAFVKIQVSDHTKGFIVSDQKNALQSGDYTFKSLHEVMLPMGTDPQEQIDKMNNRKATAADKIYALTVTDELTIETVIIRYRYLGLTYETTISTERLKQPA